jgi:predicted O-methyltransferase YrrM
MLRRLAMPLVKAQVTQEVVDYLARHARQDAVLERVARETAAMPRAEMATTPDEAALLTLRLVGARRALEVGTFTGYGAISIARGLGAGGRLKCLELDEKYAAIARRNLEHAGVAERVEIVVGPALESLRAMPAEPSYDYVFLDADKIGYPDYYEELVPAGGRPAPDRQRTPPRPGHRSAERARADHRHTQRQRGGRRARRQCDGARGRWAHVRAPPLIGN